MSVEGPNHRFGPSFDRRRRNTLSYCMTPLVLHAGMRLIAALVCGVMVRDARSVTAGPAAASVDRLATFVLSPERAEAPAPAKVFPNSSNTAIVLAA